MGALAACRRGVTAWLAGVVAAAGILLMPKPDPRELWVVRVLPGE